MTVIQLADHRHTPSPHYLLFGPCREVIGCGCGFRAKTESDYGCPNAVVEHLLGEAS